MKLNMDDTFLLLFCEKNSDGTKNLRLHGREMYQRFGRKLNKDDMAKLVIFLKQHPEIISLNLAYNDLGNEGIKIFAEQFLSEENNLYFLNLLHCDIEAEGMKWLSSATYLRCKSLRLVGNNLGTEGARFIGLLIENCRSLEDLDIGETDQTVESIQSLLIMVEKSPLKSLNISRIIPSSFYSQYDNSSLADDLGILLKLNTSLEILRVQKCEFDGHDVQLLIGGLYFHRNMLMLDLAANRIGDYGVDCLAEWFKTRPNLLGLRISANDITNSGASAIGLNLPFTKIRLLDLQNNKISAKGLEEILTSAKKSTQIRRLFLWGNKFSPGVLEKMEEMLDVGIIHQDGIDVKIYRSGGVRYAAYSPINHFVRKTYSLLHYGSPPELKIIKNKSRDKNEKLNYLINYDSFERCFLDKKRSKSRKTKVRGSEQKQNKNTRKSYQAKV